MTRESCPVNRLDHSVRDEPSPPWVELARGVRTRRLVEANGITLALYRMRPGTAFKLHSHLFAELGVVLSGSGRAHFGDETRDLRAGDSFYISPGTAHDFRVNEGEPVLMLNVSVTLHEAENGIEHESIEKFAARAVRP